MATMRDDLVHALQDHGFDEVRVDVSLSPAWSSDWITPGADAPWSSTASPHRGRPTTRAARSC